MNRRQFLQNSFLSDLSPITVNGTNFDGEMPGHDFLSDADISRGTFYIRLNFNSNAGLIHEKEVASVKEQLKT